MKIINLLVAVFLLCQPVHGNLRRGILDGLEAIEDFVRGDEGANHHVSFPKVALKHSIDRHVIFIPDNNNISFLSLFVRSFCLLVCRTVE